MQKNYYSSMETSTVYQSMANFIMIAFLLITLLFCYFFFNPQISKSFQGFKQNIKQEPIFEQARIRVPEGQRFSEVQTTPSITTPATQIDNSQKSAEKIFLTYELGDMNQSASLVADFLVDYPQSPYNNKVRLIGAQVMHDRGDYKGAMNYIKKVLSDENRSTEDSTEAILLMGAIAQEKNQYDSYVQNYLEQAYFQAAEPTKSQLALYLGYLMLSKQDYTESLKYFNNVIGENSLLGKASLYKAQKMYPEAINELENFIKLYSSSANFDYVREDLINAINLQSEALIARGYLDNAERLYSKIINYFPNSKEADKTRLELAQLYYQKQNINQSIKILQDILTNEDKNRDPEALFMLGKLSFEINRPEDSLGYFRVLIEEYPHTQYVGKAKEWQNLVSESLRN